jgi:CRP/FNR family transcriptional regulator, cyclic AMP receptor protein
MCPFAHVLDKASAYPRQVPRTAPSFNAQAFLDSAGLSKRIVQYGPAEMVFSQGDRCDAVMYIQTGGVKLSVLSAGGREAVVAMLSAGDFFGEGCLAGQPLRISTVAALVDSSITRLEKTAVIRVLHEEPAFSEVFMAYLLARNIRMEADLIDQTF